MKPSTIFSHWKRIREGLIETVDKFDQSQLDFTPFDGSYSAARIMLHIADAEEGWFQYVIGKKYEQWPSHFTVENYPTLADIKSVLEQVHRETEDFLDSLGESDLERIINTPWDEAIPLGWIIWHVLEHEVHHRGELSLILGMLGVEGLDV